MKTIKLIAAMFLIGTTASMFTACVKDSNSDSMQIPGVNQVKTTQSTTNTTIEYCGTVKTVNFLAGQTIPAGSVTVGNDETNLYVTFSTTNGWEMKETHLYVGDGTNLTNKAGNAAPGQFPYKTTHDPRVTSFTYTIPLQGLPECMVIAAHAAVEKWVNGTMVDSQTAWGEGSQIGKNWAMKFEYCKQVCEPGNPGENRCYQDETAWVFGPRYVNQGNWATYTPYDGTAKTETIYAGQTYEAGTATFSAAVGGQVTITITLNSNFIFQNGTELIKIQGYNTTPPSSNPAPGQFTTFKGTSTTITVPQYAFYGIHLDVKRQVPCN